MLRLKTRSQFQAVLAGNKLATSAHFAVHFLDPGKLSFGTESGSPEPVIRKPDFSHSDLWLAPMVPKRWARRAVTRNAIKRQVHNVAREFESALPSGAYVVRLRAAFAKAQFSSASSDFLKQAVRAELVQLLNRVCQLRPGMPLQGLAK